MSERYYWHSDTCLTHELSIDKIRQAKEAERDALYKSFEIFTFGVAADSPVDLALRDMVVQYEAAAAFLQAEGQLKREQALGKDVKESAADRQSALEALNEASRPKSTSIADHYKAEIYHGHKTTFEHLYFPDIWRVENDLVKLDHANSGTGSHWQGVGNAGRDRIKRDPNAITHWEVQGTAMGNIAKKLQTYIPHK